MTKKYENNLSQIITNYEQNGIEKVICVGFDFESSVLAQKNCQRKLLCVF